MTEAAAMTEQTATTERLRSAVRELMPRAHDDLSALVAMKSVADARQYPPKECAAAAQWVLDAFREQGFAGIEAIETSDGSAALRAHRTWRPVVRTRSG